MKDISPSFCIHPWVNLMVNTTGYYNFCCIAADNILRDEQNYIVAASNTTPDQAWNCKSIRNARKAMVDGEKLSVCKTCWLQEDIGKESYRQKHNKEWIIDRLGEKEVNRRVQETIDNDYYFRCKDQPQKPEGDRNENTQSYSYKLIGTQPLNFLEITPNN